MFGNKNASNIFRIIGGGYLAYIGIRLIQDVSRSQPANAAFLICMGGVFTLIGVCFAGSALYSLYKVWRKTGETAPDTDATVKSVGSDAPAAAKSVGSDAPVDVKLVGSDAPAAAKSVGSDAPAVTPGVGGEELVPDIDMRHADAGEQMKKEEE